MSTDWQAAGLCIQVGPHLFTPDNCASADALEAVAICRRCPSQEPCLAAALAEEAGQTASQRACIRGGTTPRQRIAIERQHAA